jgi:hypothetical protein
MKHEGIAWVFSESQVRYIDNGVGWGGAFTYEWINNDTIKMTDGGSQTTRTWRITFKDNDNIIVNEPDSGYRRTLVRIADMD